MDTIAKKLLSLALLVSIFGRYLECMEVVSQDATTQSQEINPAILAAIEKAIPGYFRSIALKSQSLDGEKIAILQVQNPTLKVKTGFITLWDGQTGKLIDANLAGRQSDVISLGFNQDGTKVVVNTSKGSREYTAFPPSSADAMHAIREHMGFGDYIPLKSQSPNRKKLLLSIV